MKLSDYEYYREPAGVIYCGDCLTILPLLTDKVDLVLTDPPYLGREDLFSVKALSVLDPLIDDIESVVFWPANYNHKGEPSATHIWHKSIPIHPKSITGNVAGHQYEQIKIYNGEKKCRVYRCAAIIPNFRSCADELTKHPTQKPLDLLKQLIASRKGQTILDPFLGSGTTAVAAKQLGRDFIGIEISEKYCNIAKQRLAQEELF